MVYKDLIGIPYVSGGTDRNGMDCWTLASFVMKREFGIETSDVFLDKKTAREIMLEFETNTERGNWVEVVYPCDGDAVIMKKYKRPLHVGVFCQRGVLHAHPLMGVVWQRLNEFKSLARARPGYMIHQYLRHRSRIQ